MQKNLVTVKHKLKFVKISDAHLFAGVGFGGNIFSVLNALTNISHEDVLVVDMETNECVCTQPDLKDFNTNNCWEYFFEQNSLQDNEKYELTTNLVPGEIHYGSDFSNFESYLELKEKFYKSFKLKSYILDLLNDFYKKNLSGKKTLGVQVRLTDMKKHNHVHGLDLYLKKINELIELYPEIEQIFVSTDDSNVIDILKSSTNRKVVYYEDMFRADSLNPHTDPYDRYHSNRKYHKYKLALEGVLEIFTLTKCNYLLTAHVSAFSMVASILSENIKKVFKL
jgi:hypothetical protein